MCQHLTGLRKCYSARLFVPHKLKRNTPIFIPAVCFGWILAKTHHLATGAPEQCRARELNSSHRHCVIIMRSQYLGRRRLSSCLPVCAKLVAVSNPLTPFTILHGCFLMLLSPFSQAAEALSFCAAVTW